MKQTALKNTITKELPFFMMMPALLWQVLFFYVPFAIVISLSFIKGIDGSLTFEYYKSLCDFAHVKILSRSLLFAFLNACVCLLIAYPTAYFLARKITHMKNFFVFLLILPFWINIVVQIYAWFFVLDYGGVLNSLLLKLGIISQPLHLLNNMISVFFVMTYCYLPFMVMPLYTALEKLDERLIESSYDLGANSWQTFFKITLPLSWSGIKTGFFLVFVPSFGEFLIPILVGGSKKMFVGSLISHYFLTAHNAHTGAAFMLVSGIILLLAAVLLNRFFSKKVHEK
jgi:spermidine/putrescine transport system permease protein